MTDDLRARIKSHNAGQVYHTSKYKPWRVNTYLGFSDEARAIAFEKYLKTRSGRGLLRGGSDQFGFGGAEVAFTVGLLSMAFTSIGLARSLRCAKTLRVPSISIAAVGLR